MTLLLATLLTTQPVIAQKVARKPVCSVLQTACKRAGFTVKSLTERKDIWADCAEPVLAGLVVPGLIVGDDDVTACRKSKIDFRKFFNEL